MAVCTFGSVRTLSGVSHGIQLLCHLARLLPRVAAWSVSTQLHSTVQFAEPAVPLIVWSQLSFVVECWFLANPSCHCHFEPCEMSLFHIGTGCLCLRLDNATAIACKRGCTKAVCKPVQWSLSCPSWTPPRLCYPVSVVLKRLLEDHEGVNIVRLAWQVEVRTSSKNFTSQGPTDAGDHLLAMCNSLWRELPCSSAHSVLKPTVVCSSPAKSQRWTTSCSHS